MEMFLAAAGLFILAVSVQCSLIMLQQLDQRLGVWWGRHAFSLYNVITLIPWTLFVLVYVTLQFQPHPVLLLVGSWGHMAGCLFLFIGASLAGGVGILLGPARLNGQWFFKAALKHERIVSGPFSLMKNPMYTGYFFVFLGLALLNDSWYDLAIAAESLVLLNGVQAWVENRDLQLNQ